MHGQGLLTLTNGEKYAGQFKEGMIDGKGQYYDLDNEVILGIWKNGIFAQL